MNKLKFMCLLFFTCLSSSVTAMEISGYVTLNKKQQGVYVIAYLDTKIIDASNEGYNSYYAERWGIQGAYNAIKKHLTPNHNDQKPINFNVALILDMAFIPYCKSIEDKNGEIGPK